MRKLNQEEMYMASLGWYSTNNMNRYFESGQDWVLVIAKANEQDMFLVPEVAEFRDGEWFNKNGEVIPQENETIAYWKSLGPNPNMFFTLKSLKKH